MASLNISSRQASSRMSCEAERKRQFEVSEGRSKWTSGRRCRRGTISFRATQIVTAGFILRVFPPLLLGAASSLDSVDPLPDCNRTSPLISRKGWKKILRSFRTVSDSKRTQPKHEVSASISTEETLQRKPPSVFRSTSLPHSGYPERPQVEWDASTTALKTGVFENLESTTVAEGAEKSSLKEGGPLRAASELMRRASARAPSLEDAQVKRSKLPQRSQSFFHRPSAAPIPLSSSWRGEGRSKLSGGECGSDPSGAHNNTLGRVSLKLRSPWRLLQRRNTYSLTDRTIFDVPAQEERVGAASASTNKSSTPRFLRIRSGSKDSNRALTPRASTGGNTGKIRAATEEDSAVESGADTCSSAPTLEKHSQATPDDQEENEGTPELLTQDPGAAKAGQPQEKSRRPWYLTVQMDTGKVSFSKEDTTADSTIPYVKVVLLRESDVQTATEHALLPLKLRLPHTVCLCFTLENLPLVLEGADEVETTAILNAVQGKKKEILFNAMRLSDAGDKSLNPNSIWCVVLNANCDSESGSSTFVVLSDDEEEDD